MQIGFYAQLDRGGGGVFQYTLSMLRALMEWQRGASGDEMVLFADQKALHEVESLYASGAERLSIHAPHPSGGKQGIRERLLKGIGDDGPLREFLRKCKRSLPVPHPDDIQWNDEHGQWFREHGADLMLYPSTETISFEARVPYITAIHDLQHRLQPEFAETSANGEWERREYLFRNCARHAVFVLVDSEAGKEDVLTFYEPYGVTPGRVKVLPTLPADYLHGGVSSDEIKRTRQKYDLPERYLFYPAQFWPHKNQARIVQALERLKLSTGLEIPVVFCGSASSNIRQDYFSLVAHMAEFGQVSHLIHYCGYLPDEDMSALYAGAVALVMPTFFGPANIPVWEAWAMGCPVITSDIRGIREQAGDAALLADPKDTCALAEAIRKVWTDDQVRQDLIARGSKRLARFTVEDHRQRLAEILEDARERLTSRSNHGL
ncbi:MAG: hypothetical protein AUJ92_19765 [Armatimonadetes bacterium CG2_30_59_28]|nr:MAG: hypothetical protein AUJ92_19765 [Armatimonadetes bacterium CG2_30_59_28]